MDTARAPQGCNDTALNHTEVRGFATSLPELCCRPHCKGTLGPHLLHGVTNTAKNAMGGGGGSA